MKLLTETTIRKHDHNLKLFPCYTKYVAKLRLSKNWKPCTTEVVKLKKKVDKLSIEYTNCENFGQKVKAKRIFKKAMRLTDKISVLLGFEGRDKAHGGKTNAKQAVTKEDRTNVEPSV